MVRRIASMAMLPTLALWACSPGTDPGPCASVECFEDRGQLEVHAYRHRLADTTIFHTVARASFVRWMGPYAGAVVEAGRVRLNGIELDVDDRQEYRLADSTMPLRVEPEPNIWTVSGSADVSAFVDTVTIPEVRPALLSPRPGDTLSIATALTVAWIGTPGDSGRYQLAVVHLDRSESRRTFTLNDLPVSGSISVPLAARGAAPGEASIHLIHTRRHYTTIADGVRVTSTVVLIDRVAVVLVD